MDQQQGSRRVGYSDNITDAAFHRAEAGKGRDVSTLRVMLFVVPLVVVVLLWRAGTLPLMIALLLAALAVVLMLPPILKERRRLEDRTYDGTIAQVERREPVSSADISRIDPKARAKLVLHTIRIEDEDGKLHTYERTGDLLEDYREYYHVGDRVRHHRGFDLPEKYDKSGDERVICIACGRTGSMDSRRCGECGTVLLR